jgi:cystathionine beta-lyase
MTAPPTPDHSAASAASAASAPSAEPAAGDTTVAQGIATALIHHRYQPPAGFASPQVGVFKASTVIFPDTAAMRARDWRHKTGYTYGLHGTPTTFTLEARIATLEGGSHTLLAPSGLAAVALVNQALLSQGDEVLLPYNLYGPGRELVRHELARWGITHGIYDPLQPDSLAAAMGPRTKLVWVEPPGSVTMEFPDVPALAAAAHAGGAVVALDNTWGAGIAFNAFALGADVVMQALTKYASGGGDVLMGAVTVRDEALHRRRAGAALAAQPAAALRRQRRRSARAGGLAGAAARRGPCAAPGAAGVARP